MNSLFWKMSMKIIGRRELRLCSGCASNYSLSAPKWVLSEVDNIVPKSNIWRSGRSFSSSIPSPVVEPRKSYKRVSKDVRRTMVESFVKEYQSLNEGKFPTAFQTMKQVGGSYYVLRSMLQELEHKSTVLHAKNRNEISQEKKPYEESECLILTVDESSSIMSIKEETKTTSIVEAIKDTESGVNGDKHLKANSLSQNSTQVERTLPAMEPTPHVSDSNFTSLGRMQKRKNKKASDTPSKLNDSTTVDISLDNDVDLAATSGHPQEKKKLSHLRPKIIEDDKTTELGKDSTKFEHTENEIRPLEASLDAAEFPRSIETSVEQPNDSDLSKKSTLWGNLKSFADGIINLWRKR